MSRLLLAAALALAVVQPPAPDGSAVKPDRIVAIGDVHGALDELTSILRAAELIDSAGDWVGGTAHFVQTGDLTDRGTFVRDALELMMKLERQAGGRVHTLLGNHELMNLIANDRDALINPEIFARFAETDSEDRREAAWKAWQKWRRGRLQAQRRADPEGTAELSAELSAVMAQDREAWLAAHPPGLIEYREAFGVAGELGRWLRGLPVALKLGDTLFIHGGVGPRLADASLAELDNLHHRHVSEWDAQRRRLEKKRLILPFFSWGEIRAALEHQLFFPGSSSDRQLAAEAWERMNAIVVDLFSADSPLWYRGYAPPPLGLTDGPLAALLDSTDSNYGVRRTVAGHSPLTNHSILDRLGGRLFLIDTGMLTSYYGGRPSALEITAGAASPLYLESEAPASTPRQVEPASMPTKEVEAGESGRLLLGADGSPLPFQEREEIERFLRDASVISSEPVGQGKSGAIKLLLEEDGTSAHAIFHGIDEQDSGPTRPVRLDDGTQIMFFRDSYRGQVAVYELSKLLDMDNVPPAVLRTVNGQRGSVALWIEGGINLFGWRQREGSDPSDPRLHRQLYDMRVFDNLIDNTDRNSQNIFWTAGFDLWLIDHTRTMSQSRKLLRPSQLTRCSRPLFDALERLDADEVRRRLDRHVRPFEVKALLMRRDKILEVIRENIRKQGEAKVLFEPDSSPVIEILERHG